MKILELRWGHIPLETKKLYVRLLLGDVFTREAIGSFFGTTKNAVVGFQHKNLSGLTGKKVGIKDTVTTERLEALLVAHYDKAVKKATDRRKTPEVAVPPVEHPDPMPPSCPPDETPAPPKAQVATARSARTERPKPDAPEVSRTLAASEATQCIHSDEKGHRCGYEHLPGSDSCGRVGHET